MNTPLLSFVLGTRNRWTDVRRLLDSIEDTVDDELNYEVVISDASDLAIEEQPIATVQMWNRLQIIRESPPLGCTKGYNVAFRRARGRYCLWLNDDCILEPHCAIRSIRFMETSPTIGLGAIAYAEPGKPHYHVNSYMGMLYANFGIISRALGEEVDWFDDEFPMYGCDNSLTFRVLMRDRGVARVPNATIFHYATYDTHRIQNNDDDRRRADVDRLVEKYAPHLDAMRATYQRFGGDRIRAKDQTPPFARKHLTR
jgi:GT2 family glycosyltransferase